MAASPELLIRPLLVQDNVNIDERRLKVSGLLEQVDIFVVTSCLFSSNSAKSTNGAV